MKRISIWLLSILFILSTIFAVGCMMPGGNGNGGTGGGNTGGGSGTEDGDDEEYGTLTIEDMYVLLNGTAEIVPVFSDSRKSETLTYTFNGEDISISNKVVTGKTINTTTIVTAKSAHFETTFKVYVVAQKFTIEDVVPMYPGYYFPLSIRFEDTTLNSTANDITFEIPGENTGLTISNGIVTASSTATIDSYEVLAVMGNFKTTFNIDVRNINGLDLGANAKYTSSYNRIKNTISGKDYDVLFAGDSFLDNGAHYSFFNDFATRFNGLNTESVALSSSRTKHWIFFAQEFIIPTNPENIVFHIGTNDIFDGMIRDVTTNVKDLSILFNIIHSALPDTTIYWWTIEQRINQSNVNPIIEAVNLGVKNFADIPGNEYLKVVDTYSLMDTADSTMWADTIHPSCPHGYDVLMRATVDAGLDSRYAPAPVTFDIANVPLIYPGYYVDLDGEIPGSVTYDFGNSSGLSIANGKLTASSSAGAGTFEIKATAGGYTDTFTVTVKSTSTIYTNVDGGKGSFFGTASNATEFTTRYSDMKTRIQSGFDANELTLFMGDSFMDERWFLTDFYTRFLGKNAHTVGISSSRAEQWIWYMQDLVIPANPKNLVIHIGTNDLFDGSGQANTVTGYLTEMFDLLHERLPNTMIYWWTIEERIGQSASSGKVTATNANINTYANGKSWLKVIDTYSEMDVNDSTMWKDSIHPSCPHGYDVLIQKTFNAGLTITDYSGGVTIGKDDGNQYAKYVTNYVNNFVFKTTLTITNWNNVGHVSLNINNSTSARFVIMDFWNGSWSTRTGKLKYTSPATWSSDVLSYHDFNSTDKTIEVAVYVTEYNAYLFVDGALECAIVNVNAREITNGFSFGAEKADVKFTNINFYTSSTSEFKSTAYTNAIANYEALNTDVSKVTAIQAEYAGLSLTRSVIGDVSVVSGTNTFDNAVGVGKTNDFVFETSMTIDSFGNNAHVTIHFNDNASKRFLIWNNNSDGVFKFIVAYNTTNAYSATLTSGTAYTCTVAIMVTNGNAYMFVNGSLKCTMSSVGTVSSLEFGAESLSGTFKSNKVYTSGSTEYANYLAKI